MISKPTVRESFDGAGAPPAASVEKARRPETAKTNNAANNRGRKKPWVNAIVRLIILLL
jgi:hypothetical protein